MQAIFRRRARITGFALTLAGLVLHLSSGVRATMAVPNDERAIAHALNRLAFGARPGDVARIKETGLASWIDRQLTPDRITNAATEARLANLETLGLSSQTIARDLYLPAREERRRRQQAMAKAGGNDGNVAPMNPSMDQRREVGAMNDVIRRQREVFAELSEAKLLRAVYSERQLEEVLADFWFNHFNVFARKGQTEIYITEYERETIRPHVLGSFRDLLGATAKSPAMLVYLDNWTSADPEAGARSASAPRRRGMQPLRPQPAQNRPPRGLNENYARELLELHTLGVDGGYSQQDVINVARAFTGWSISRPDATGFRFVPQMHDRKAKKVLGQTIPAGGGMDDGEKVLDMLAHHPATARHIAFKLAQRFVSDTPPQDLVDRVAQTFVRTKGDLREVVRAIVTAPEFLAPEAYRAKVKTPFEFVASALRATDADVQEATSAVRALAALGMPLYLCQPPTGYDETAETWVSSGALVNRMNFALSLAGGQLRGIRLPAAVPNDVAIVRTRIVRDALADDVSASTLGTIAKASSVAQTLALAIGSPEFQRQ